MKKYESGKIAQREGKKAKCLVWFSAGKPKQTGEKTISTVLWALGQANEFNIR
jgi:hypothetical protein